MSESNVLYVTEEGLQKLQEEYHHLVHVVREEVKAELAEARSQGDLSENADYDAARDKQSQVEGRINELENMLQPGHYVIIEKKSGRSKTVSIGSTVTLWFSDLGTEEKYTIVGSTEADPLNGKLSNETPLARAILDKKVGDEVEVPVKVPYTVKIMSTNN